MRVLLVEDEKPLAAALGKIFEKNKILVDVVNDGIEGKLLSEHDVYDVIILDIMLPGMTGLEILRSIREAGKNVPILLLTAKDDTKDKVNGLNMGADDYLVKPFDLDELSARIRALMRRHGGRASPVIEHGALTLNPATHEVTLAGLPVNLSGREFALLHALVEQPGVPLSRAQLEDRIYGWNEEIESNAIEVYIHSLRRKLGAEWIKNVRGVGYRVPELP